MRPQIIVPDFFQPIMEDTTKIIEKKPKDSDDQLLIELADSDSWKKLKDIIEKKIMIYERYTTERLVDAGMEEYGFLCAINSQVKSALQSVINVVEVRKKVRKIKDDDKKLAEKQASTIQ